MLQLGIASSKCIKRPSRTQLLKVLEDSIRALALREGQVISDSPRFAIMSCELLDINEL